MNHPTSSSQPSTRFPGWQFLKEQWAQHPLLTLVGVASVLILLATLVGIVVDPRVITGMPAWVKPAKFAISTAIYTFTLLWFLSFIRGHHRLVSFVSNVTAISLAIEVIIIVAQVIRGTSSHFNNTTPFDRTLFLIMAGFITLVFIMGMIAVVLLLLQKQEDRVFTWTLRLSMGITLVGMAVAFLMTTGLTPLQREVVQEKGYTTTIGAHSVGVVDGGPGLPFVGWSTEGGDLRIPHFVGMHALQIVPLFWWLFLRRRSSRLSNGHRVALIWTISMGYLGMVGILTWQALRSQPIIAPDTLTLSASAILTSAFVLAIVAILGHARTRARTIEA